jgi:hypothetical protein
MATSPIGSLGLPRAPARPAFRGRGGYGVVAGVRKIGPVPVVSLLAGGMASVIAMKAGESANDSQV